MRLFLQDDQGDFPTSVGVNFDAVPRTGTVVAIPGRPSILVKAVRPALPAREDDEVTVPAHIYAVALQETAAQTASLEVVANASKDDSALVSAYAA